MVSAFFSVKYFRNRGEAVNDKSLFIAGKDNQPLYLKIFFSKFIIPVMHVILVLQYFLYFSVYCGRIFYADY
jgi:hypothetical protein